MSEDSRPRERLLKFGVKNLSEAELFALVLGNGTRSENVVDMSNRLVSKYGLDKLFDCSLKELQEIKGIGFAKACQILALGEINKRHNQSKIRPIKVTCAKDVYDYFSDELKDEKQENFIVLLLSTKSNIIGHEIISKGILDATIVHPREIFRPAIKNSASKIILVHNHPSGDASPSQDDLEITEKIIKLGEELEIKVLDHIIIGREDFWSYSEENC